MHPCSQNRERGAALVVAMISMVFLSILGLSAIYLSSSDIDLAGQSQHSLKAFYAADAGVEQGFREAIGQYPWLSDPNNSAFLQGSTTVCANAMDTQCGYIEDSLGNPLTGIPLPEGDVSYTVQGRKLYNGTTLDVDHVLLYSVGTTNTGAVSKISAMLRWNPNGLEGYGGQFHGGPTNSE